MGKVPVFGCDATRTGPRNYERILNPRCCWQEDGHGVRCDQPCEEGLPVCWHHGFAISLRMVHLTRERTRNQEPPDDADEWPSDEELDAQAEDARSNRQAFVYYLMLSPTTVKIGTTRHLRARIAAHGSELQYVVALEHGSFDVEKARHEQFPMERHGVKEVFTLSDALRQHIENLAPQRDELFALATKRFNDAG